MMVRKAIVVCTTAEDRKWNSEAEVADVRLTQTNGVLAQTQEQPRRWTNRGVWTGAGHRTNMSKYAFHLQTSTFERNWTGSHFLSEMKKPVERVSCYSLAVVHFLNACGYLYLISRAWPVKRDDSLTG